MMFLLANRSTRFSFEGTHLEVCFRVLRGRPRSTQVPLHSTQTPGRQPAETTVDKLRNLRPRTTHMLA